MRALVAALGMLPACVSISGPCYVVDARGDMLTVECEAGGAVSIFSPGRSVATAARELPGDDNRERINNDWKARHTRDKLPSP